ncbi:MULTISPECIES: hypothetical protein [Rhizobium]|uniref:Uncharacterized protein n=1 Tax=Rhizobium sophoriradicis TaxID=1535245 RepID=A0A2A5KLQ7_9HYPH|nr:MULTISPECIES: hypothetical protein [Rhizobium]ANL34100.1 hypothetical protein AMC89_CH02040 [Rhizobium phaseoli]ANL52849.1 hypothetical protein AMC86_CH01687 [Rhizobium phaseoli]ANL97823.1 hypothetical protein AMC79_CH02033 [Rhizobium phaseoli]PCK77881.1 hypothetical protein CPT34_27850 [Rhizobium sophoriradicis]PWI54472.1 hypothetical protein B5K03_09870 [Rhizobium phaseoli]
MRLVPFHYAGTNNPTIYINPEHVVAVRAFTSSTHIYVSVLGKDAGPSYYPVRESIEEVVKLLTA